MALLRILFLLFRDIVQFYSHTAFLPYFLLVGFEMEAESRWESWHGSR